MKAIQLGRILLDRRRLRRRERWTPDELARWQSTALLELRRFSSERSPFYARLHHGMEGAPLEELPVVTKAMIMSRFDEVVTDPRLRLASLEAHVATIRGDDRFAGHYWVSASSGSSGLRTIIPSNAHEWSMIIASYGRANEWGGVRISPFHKVTMAVVSSRTPFHQSARVASTVSTSMIKTLRLDASEPLGGIVAQLSEQQPEILVAYNSMLRILAEEQLGGRLSIRPHIVNGSSEVLTPDARDLAARAWGRQPFEVYAATETGGIAAECERHRGMHLFEDLVIPEVVDDDYRPVPDGEAGSRLLVTVLFSRSLPLIRYELTDRVRLSTTRCDCGRPFKVVAAVEGRTDDVLRLPGVGGEPVSVHPVLFHSVLDKLPVAGWQVRQEKDRLRLLLSPGSAHGLEGGAIAKALTEQLSQRGITLPIALELVEEIPAGASGKRPMVVGLRL